MAILLADVIETDHVRSGSGKSCGALMPRRAAAEELSAAMHIVFVHSAPYAAPTSQLHHESCRTFLVCTVILTQRVEMTQNVPNRGNLGQVAALKGGYVARTLLDDEQFSQTVKA